MLSENPKRYLAVLDVGHGSAAVLHDEGGVVVFDTGRGAHVGRHLSKLGVYKVEALFLSHSDCDHIGGAITLLMNTSLRIGSVFLNPDSSKNTHAFQHLRYALCEAEKRTGTKVEPSLTTNTKLSRKGTYIEVLYPPISAALGGVGGRNLSGNRLTSNSLSAAIRITSGPNASVLLGGDVEFGCLDEWKRQGLIPIAQVLVFPHHGGIAGHADATEAELFAYEMTKIVKPEIVVFSIHRRKFGLPRDDVLGAILKASKDVRFVCTQLPDRFQPFVMNTPSWLLHRNSSGKGHQEGKIELEFAKSGLKLRFGSPD